MNATDVEPRAPIGNEHVVRAARAEKLFASQKVVDQHSACGWMEGHKAGSTELGSSDREHALLDIDIIELQIERFGNAQTRDAEQTQKAMKDPGPQRRRRPCGRQLQRCLQQAPHFLLGVHVGSGSGR